MYESFIHNAARKIKSACVEKSSWRSQAAHTKLSSPLIGSFVSLSPYGHIVKSFVPSPDQLLTGYPYAYARWSFTC